ncbi:hypothetical protein FO519_010020 [Halicephalobus sp. NKZ332]|nr:hypothetical protein FO519_010020 [Halicephalobus sp. NKZ332]
MAVSKKKIILIRNMASFWIFGLCNNYAYFTMLSAAVDIIGKQQHKEKNDTENYCLKVIIESHCSSISTGAVLLADIIPMLLITIICPFFIQKIPFGIRHGIVCTLQVVCYLIVAYSTSTAMSLTGVVFASMGTGLGAITYIPLSSHFPRSMLSIWSSGTGGAGIIGSLAYAGLTEPHFANLSPETTCLIMLIVPVIFAVTYWFLMVIPDTVHQVRLFEPRTWLVTDPDLSTASSTEEIHPHVTSEVDWSVEDTKAGKLEPTDSSESGFVKQRKLSFKEQLLLIMLMTKYTLPPAIVFAAEYLINQGLTELIYFDCSHGFYLSTNSQYRWYQVLYQLGGFFSRSSINIYKLPFWATILLPMLQIINAVFFTFGAVYFFVPHIWIIFILILYEGLLGGSSYANSYDKIHHEVAPDVREFCLSAAGMSDVVGVVVAGFAAIPLHNFVCNQQKYHIH